MLVECARLIDDYAVTILAAADAFRIRTRCEKLHQSQEFREINLPVLGVVVRVVRLTVLIPETREEATSAIAAEATGIYVLNKREDFCILNNEIFIQVCRMGYRRRRC